MVHGVTSLPLSRVWKNASSWGWLAPPSRSEGASLTKRVPPGLLAVSRSILQAAEIDEVPGADSSITVTPPKKEGVSRGASVVDGLADVAAASATPGSAASVVFRLNPSGRGDQPVLAQAWLWLPMLGAGLAGVTWYVPIWNWYGDSITSTMSSTPSSGRYLHVFRTRDLTQTKVERTDRRMWVGTKVVPDLLAMARQ